LYVYALFLSWLLAEKEDKYLSFPHQFFIMNGSFLIFEQLEKIPHARREVLSVNIKMAERIRSENRVNRGVCLIYKI